jgi:hypothetical protein
VKSPLCFLFAVSGKLPVSLSTENGRHTVGHNFLRFYPQFYKWKEFRIKDIKIADKIELNEAVFRLEKGIVIIMVIQSA